MTFLQNLFSKGQAYREGRLLAKLRESCWQNKSVKVSYGLAQDIGLVHAVRELCAGPRADYVSGGRVSVYKGHWSQEDLSARHVVTMDSLAGTALETMNILNGEQQVFFLKTTVDDRMVEFKIDPTYMGWASRLLQANRERKQAASLRRWSLALSLS